jgi:hypothetical protein
MVAGSGRWRIDGRDAVRAMGYHVYATIAENCAALRVSPDVLYVF